MPAALPDAIQSHRAELAELCVRSHVRRLSLFGSELKGQARPSSDLDLLVEFEPGRTPGFGFIALQDELEALLGRAVDLNTPGFLNARFRSRVLEEALPIYES